MLFSKCYKRRSGDTLLVPRLFLSHRIDPLVDRLVEQLDADPVEPLMTRAILVPNNQMKQWLLLEIAKRKGIAMGLKIACIDEGIFQQHSPLEVFCRIYDALRASSDLELQSYLQGNKKKLLSLTEELSLLFFTYGQYGQALFDPDCKTIDWQHAILQTLFVKGSLRMPVQMLSTLQPYFIHCFGIDYLPPLFWNFLFRAPSLSIYCFSPCIDFWEDLCSERDLRNLHRQVRKQIDSYLRDAPPLLANLGKLGRETLKIFDRFDLQMEEVYPLLEPDSLLKKLQFSLLNFQAAPKELDDSIKIFLTGSSRLKEMECVRDEILRLQLPFHEISVLAPDIEPYVPLIEFVFRDIPYRISSFDIAPQSSFRQGLVRLLNLVSGRWEAEDVLALFETPAFYRKQGWDEKHLEQFRKWVDYARIKWGRNPLHRKEVLKETLIERDSTQGSWEEGLDRLLDTIVYLKPIQMNPDLLEKFIGIISHLSNLAICGEKTTVAWADSLEMIASEWLFSDPENEADRATQSSFFHFLRDLRQCPGESLFPFAVMQRELFRPSLGQIHASHLHAVRFAPLEESALLPAKALFIIGMDEESFPRVKIASALDLLKKEKIFIPKRADRDRYLFLETLFSAQEFLRISFGHLSADEGKPVGPSLLVQELMNTLGLSATIYKSPSITASKNEGFLWPKISDSAMPEGPITIALSDLRALARHPWKFYLQKVHGIYLNEPLEDSFALQKEQLLRMTLGEPVEHVLKEAKLLPGLLGDALRLEILEKAVAWKNQLLEWRLQPFSLTFSEHCTEKYWENSNCIVPPLTLAWESGLKVHLVGEIKQATLQGLICLNEDKIGGVLKIWPEALALAIALDAPQIWMLRNGKTKRVESPENGLKSFVEYYFRCLSAPSPLLEGWADAILRKGADVLGKTIQKNSPFADPVIEWVLARAQLPTAEEILLEWGTYLQKTFSNLTALYPSRRKNHGSV